MKKLETITTPLHETLDLYFKHSDKIEVSELMAEALFMRTRGMELIHIQRTEHNNIPLKHPIAWRFNAWQQDVEKWKHDKARSQRQREEKFIFEENITRVAKAITELSAIEGDAARCLAMRKVKHKERYDRLIAITFGVKLATTIDEI